MDELKVGDLRIWHCSNSLAKPYTQKVGSIEDAKVVLTTLALYDLHLGDLIKFNAQGLEIYESFLSGPPEWIEWREKATDYDIVTLMRYEQQEVG